MPAWRKFLWSMAACPTRCCSRFSPIGESAPKSSPDQAASMKILVIAPHPDDEGIGCGGTLCCHAERGDQIAVIFLTSGEVGLKHLPRDEAWTIREAEARRAAAILKLGELFFLRCSDWTLGQEIPKAADLMRPLLHEHWPELIYLPHPGDAHPDHQAALPILRAALINCDRPAPALRLYEVWTPLPGY